MIQQKEEIMKECWIRAEQGDYDSSRITDEWIANHAPSWRRWRVMIYNLIAVKVASASALLREYFASMRGKGREIGVSLVPEIFP
jgi:hypothetical protein